MCPLHRVEKKGCDYRVKKVRIYVQLWMQSHSSSRRVLSSRPYILRIKTWPRILERFSPWFHGAWRTNGPILWHASGSRYMKVQTWDDTCDGLCSVEECTKNNIQPGLPVPFVSWQWWGQKTTHTWLVVSGSSPCYVELHFDTSWSTWRSFSYSKHECSSTSLRKHVVPTHSDSTPGCPAPFTTPHSLFLLFLPCIPHKAQGGRSSMGSWCSQNFTTQNTNTWLRTGVRENDFGRSILKSVSSYYPCL